MAEYDPTRWRARAEAMAGRLSTPENPEEARRYDGYVQALAIAEALHERLWAIEQELSCIRQMLAIRP